MTKRGGRESGGPSGKGREVPPTGAIFAAANPADTEASTTGSRGNPDGHDAGLPGRAAGPAAPTHDHPPCEACEIRSGRLIALEAELAVKDKLLAGKGEHWTVVQIIAAMLRAEKAEAEVERLKKYLNEQPALPDPIERENPAACPHCGPDWGHNEPVERECGT